MGKMLKLLRELLILYNERRIPRAAAALSYYMTMTFFPLIICLYSLLGRNYQQILDALQFVSQFISSNTADLLRSFVNYVAQSQRPGMLAAGLTVLLSSSSAAMRSVQSTIGEMQGGQRFQGIAGFLFSVILSIAFVAVVYFAILVLFTGRDFLERINGLLPFADISSSWSWVRFLLLAGIVFVIVRTLYTVSRQSADRYPTVPGAVFATVGMVVMSFVFSKIIAVSARYPLVYGSLASLILLMLWLFLSCQIIYLGAALNLVVRKVFSKKGLESE